MSLTSTDITATAEELRANLVRAGLSAEELADWLGLPTAEVPSVIAMTDEPDPATVWLVRDAIEATLRAEGDVGDWAVLTEANRARAREWFDLRELPAR